MTLLLFLAPVFYPLIDAGWTGPEDFQQAICSPPEPPMFISSAKIREQSRFYISIEDPELRGRILRTLREADNPDLFAELRILLEKETDPALQADLLYLMARIVRQEQISAPEPADFRKWLKHPMPLARIGAAELLISAGHTVEIVSMLEKEKTEAVPAAVFNRLFSAGVTLSAADLKKLAASTVQSTRYGALRALAASDAKADSNKLLNEAADGADVGAQEAVAAGAAVQIAATEKLAEKLAGKPDLRVRLRIAGSVPETAARTALLTELLKDASPFVRAEAASSLIRAARSEKLIGKMAALLHDPALQVREAAGKTLAHFAERKLSSDITSAINDPQAYAQLILILEACGNAEYAPLASRILTHARAEKNTDLQVKAIRALAAMKASSAASLIIDAAASESGDVRKAAAKALRVFPGAATTEALKRLMKDRADDTAVAALETIYHLQDPGFMPHLAAAVLDRSKSPLYRAAACRALCATPREISENAVTALNTLLLTKCIPVPMALPTYDSGATRACALMTLFKSAQAGNARCKEAFSRAVKRLERPVEKALDDGFADRLLLEYFRQIKLLRDGKEVTPMRIEPVEPEYYIQKARKTQS